MARFRRIRAGRRTREVVSWAIGLVVVLVVWWLVTLVGHRLGWSWP